MIVTPASTHGTLHERVLLLGDDAARGALTDAGLDPYVCDDVETLCEAIAQGAAAVIVPEEALSGESLVRLRDVLAAQPRWSDLPVIVLGSPESGWDVLAALEPAGAATLLERPVRPGTLVAAAQVALRARRRQYELRDHLAEAARQERALRDGHERARRLLETSPDGLLAVTPDARVLWANVAALRLMGAADVRDATDRSLLDFIADPDRAAVANALQRAARTSRRQPPTECRWRTGAGPGLCTELVVTPMPWGATSALHVAVRDVSARIAAEERRRFLGELSDRLREISDPAEVQRVAAAALAERLNVPRVVFCEVDDATGIVTRGEGYGVPPVDRSVFRLDEFGEGAAAALRRGGVLVLDDARTDPRTAPAAAAFEALRLGASLCAGVVLGGRLASIVAAYQPEPRVWTEAEEELIEEVARRAWPIVERARALLGLRESEERFRLIADAAPVLMWVADRDGTCAYFNRAWREFTGVSGGCWLDCVHPDDADLGRSVYRGAIERREAFVVELRLQRIDGAYRWVEVQGVPRAGPSGAFEGFVAACVDITERRDTEDALRRSEEHFRTMADGAPVLIWMSGADKAGIYFNKTWLDFTGRPLEEQLGTGWMSLVHPDDTQALAVCAEAFAARRPFKTEFRLRRYDGEYRWVLDTGIPRFGPDGRFAGFIGSCVDITDAKQAELTLRRSEEHFRALAESLPQIVWASHADGTLDYYNHRWEEYTGLKPSPSDPCFGAPVVHPDDAGPAAAAWAESVRTGQPLQVTVRLRRADGMYRWYLARAYPVRGSDGRVVRWFGTGTDIDEQKRLEESLRESEARLRLAAAAANVGMWSWDLATRELMWTDTCKRMFGLDATETVTYERFLNLIHPDDRARVESDSLMSIEHGADIDTEYRIIRPDGAERRIVSRGQTFRDSAGRAIRMTGVVLDITEAREAEGELRALQERLEVAQWGGGFGVFEWDLKTNRVKWTSGMERLFGLAPGTFEETYDAWVARVPPEDVTTVRAAVDAAIAERRPEVGFFFRAIDGGGADGGGRWVEAKCSIVYDQVTGEPLRIVGINLDVTHLKEAEEAARRGEARFRELADAMPQIVWAADANGRVYYGNRRWHERIADEGDPAFDRREAWLRQVHPDDRALVTEAWATAVRTGGPYQAEYRFLDRPTGTYRWYLDRAAPVPGPGGRPLRWYGTSTDIDETKRVQERLGEIVNELNRSNRELEDFAHIASHDLKEPLRGIRNYSSFLLEDYDHLLDDEGKRKLRTIDRLCKRMDDLISSLLYYSQVGRTQLAVADTDLNQVVLEVLESLTPSLTERGVDVRLPKPLPVVRCDRIRVAEVYRNLLTNAIKYNDKPNPWVEISWVPGEAPGAQHAYPAPGAPAVPTAAAGVPGTPTIPPTPGGAILYVRDNGIGIPTHHYGTVFGIFKRLHGRDDYGGGTGSGLAFVKRIIERHRGRIWVESVEREGTTFWFTLGREEHASPETAGRHR